MTDRWSTADIPDLHGVSAVVTGGNSGLGLWTVIGLARAGARVVLASRDEGRGLEALAKVRDAAPGADVVVQRLDLADLASVRRFAGQVTDLDLLVNNAGVMAIPRRETADGFEMQIGTNHLGHFALTGVLLPALLRGSVAGGPPRVVTVSSGMHRPGRIHRPDLMHADDYKPWTAYSQSKLANLLFMRELQRRVDAAGLSLLSLAAHPGYAATNLQGVAPQMTGSRVGGAFMKVGNAIFAQSAEHGAWPTLRAATDPTAKGGDYFGPRGPGEQRGRPKRVGMTAAARDDATAEWLWQESERLTGVGYPELTGAGR